MFRSANWESANLFKKAKIYELSSPQIIKFQFRSANRKIANLFKKAKIRDTSQMHVKYIQGLPKRKDGNQKEKDSLR